MKYNRWPDERHASHKNVVFVTEALYSYMCKDCGATNNIINGWDDLRIPCEAYAAHILEQKLLDKVKKSLYVSTSKNLLVCSTCKGRGITSEEVCISYHNNDYETKYSKCSKCDGIGKIVETNISVSVSKDLEEKTSRPATEQDIETMINKGHL
jgi:hypothetical protein